MNKIIKTFAVLILIQVGLAWTVQVNGQEQKQKADKTQTMKCWASMTCANCQAKIEKNIAFEKGVTALEVDLPSKLVTITYRPQKTNPEKLEKAIRKLGFKTEIITDKK